MKVFKKVLIIFASIMVGLLMLFNVYQYVCLNVLHEDLAVIQGYAILEVVSGSMEPTIHVGDLIVIDTKCDEFHANDIVTFRDDNDNFVTHRIISIHDEKMITKGDNNNSSDEESDLNTIVGRYLFRLPALGMIMASLKTPFVMVMILIVGVLLCLFVSMDKDGNLIQSEEEKEYQEFLEFQKKEEKEKKEKTSKTSKKGLKKKD